MRYDQDMTGPALASLRRRSCQRLKDVSDGTGFSMATLSRWESGSVSPRVDELDKVLEHHACTMGDFHRLRVALGPSVLVNGRGVSPIAPSALEGE